MTPLTDKQRTVLDFLRTFQHAHGWPPSTREIQAHFGFSSQTGAVNYLNIIERKGYIRRDPRKARSITILAS